MMYTVVYKYGGQYWLVCYINGISEQLPTREFFVAALDGAEIVRWGDD